MRWSSSTCRFPAITWAPIKAIENAGRILKETRCQAVKLEGGAEQAEVIAALVSAGIPVMAHCGLRPQSVHQLGGYKVQRDEEQLLADASAAEEAGAFAVVLECIPAESAAQITASVRRFRRSASAPGPAATARCWSRNDLLGLTSGYVPRFVKAYADLQARTITDAVDALPRRSPRAAHFPSKKSRTFK